MASLAFRPFAPGVLLMRRLRLSVKLSLMGLMLLVPMAVLVATLAVHTSEEIDVASHELVGARQVSALIDLIAGLQAHRDLSSHGNDEAARARRSTVLAAMKTKVDELNAPAEPLRSADATIWPALQQAVAALADGSAPKQRDELFEHHSRAIALAIRQLDLTAEASGLLLDPVAESYYRMDLAVDRVAPWLEALSVARGKGTAVLHRGEATTQDRANLLIQAEAIERATADVQTRIASLQRLDQPAPAEWAQASAASAKLVAHIRREFTQDAITAEPGAYFEMASAALDGGVKLKQSVVDALVSQLEARVKEGRFTMARDLVCAALGVGAVAYLALSLYLSFTGAVRALHRGVEKVLGGDLSQRIVIEGRDEMAEIGTMVERMNERLSSLVAEIRSSAVRVTMSGEQVAAGSHALAERTEQQAASLRETVVTVQQLSAAVAQNADEASRLDQLTARLRDQAEAAGTEMNDSIQAMGALEDGSRRVGEIIGVIDSIAFQTNILALNAAVEAARAGEAGRGFAVVATEVRQLAQRSAAAAGEIRTLIARSSEQVEVSVRRTRDVGSVLTSLVDGVRSVSQSLQTIAEASARQSADLQGVTQSVGNLDEITRQNADAVGQSTAAAGELVGRAGALRESVAMIRLRQGSADEARELVNRALALIKAQGLHGAAPALHSKDEGFVDRDLYVFVIDRVGRYVVHGAKPAMEGQRVHDVPGIDGDRFVRDSWEAAAANEGRGGWVEYDIVNPGTGAVQPKVSFVMPLDGERFIGCGIYRVQSAVAA